MPDPNADIGHLTQLHFDPANGTNYTQILLVQEVTYPTFTVEDVDITDLADTVEQTTSSIVYNPGEMTAKFFWEVNNANPNLFYTALTSGAVGKWKIVVPHATTVSATFSGYVKSLAPDPFAQKAPIMNTVTVKLTTGVTWA